MNQLLRTHADQIALGAIRAVQPDAAVRRALEHMPAQGDVVLVAAGKAAWKMAAVACDALGERVKRGVVCTKRGHVMGELPRVDCYEGGHPIPDEGSFRGTEAAIRLVSNLTENDTVLFLLSGGGSALFEKPLISPEELQDITGQLLACGADIVEINTLRKRFSQVKGGRFAQLCQPARVFSIVLSDIIGDPLDMIASGPAYPDASTAQDALRVAEKYALRLSDQARELLNVETPKSLANVYTQVTGSVRALCRAAMAECTRLGYEPMLLTDRMTCEARHAGDFMGTMLRTHADAKKNMAFVAGGETVVRLLGDGLGGRNQELALAAAKPLAGLKNAALFSLGSDGTDGPTDAAGGYVDGDTAGTLLERGIEMDEVLARNDAYHALQACGGLIQTGPTGTNVNDVTVGLIRATE
ncbi:MAG: glycerate kinase [Clostridia bacterium]|nr:glycerate kinase [Clostridia bacterium]